MSLTLHQPNLPSLSSSHLCGQSWHHTSNVDISLLLKPRERDREREADQQDRDEDNDTTANTDTSSLSLIQPLPPPVSPIRTKDQDCDAIPSPPQSVARIAPSSTSTASIISKQYQTQPDPHPSPSLAAPPVVTNLRPTNTTSVIPAKRSSSHLTTASSQHNTRSGDSHIHNSHAHPAKKQSKWSPYEDSKIISLRAEGMKWEDISRHLPGRSAISCRLHYQNYLERRSEWDEDRKDRLARLYERFKQEMWAKIADEMAIPWRAAEAMHWQIGEHDMARRAGVTPFSLTLTNNNNTNGSNNGSTGAGPGTHQNGHRHHRHNLSISRSSLGSAHEGLEHTNGRPLGGVGASHGQQQLPSLAELTAGLPAFHHPSMQPLFPAHHGQGLGFSSLAPSSSTNGPGSGPGGGGSAYNYSHSHHPHGHGGHGHHSRGHSISHSHHSHSDARTPMPGTPYSSGLPYPGQSHLGMAQPLIPSPVRGGVGSDYFLKRS